MYLFNVVDVFEYSRLAILNFHLVFRFEFSPLKSNFLAPMEVLNACVNLNALEDQKNICLLSKPLKMDGIQIFLLDVACLDFMQNVVARKHEK